MHITRAFLAGMKEAAAQEIHTIDVIDKQIAFCRGCFACKYNGGRCVIDDDMREILEQMLESDLLLFSFPLYCYGMPAMLKNLIDRMLPLSSMAMAEVNGRYVHVGQRDYSHLQYLMICGCGFPNSRRNFEPAVRQFELAAKNKSEKIACLEARKHYAWYLKGVPYAGYWKSEISKITTLEDVYRVTAGIQRELKDPPSLDDR